MKESNELVLVLCDQEEEYAHLMTHYLRECRQLPWTIHTYTDVDSLLQEEQEDCIDVLMISERTYQEKVAKLHTKKKIILAECGVTHFENCIYVDKYQQAQNVYQCLLEICLDLEKSGVTAIGQAKKTIFIGIYSPVRRCFQTTFALTMAQMFARKSKTLYMNFEHFSGISELAADAGARDLADLLYFLMADKDKFFLRLETIVRHIGNLDYVPPMKSGQNLLSISAREWERLFATIDESGRYQYVIMDLSESMQGLFDILRMCKRVFTLTKEDKVAQGKLAEYERLLEVYSYEDVLKKTKKYTAPVVRRVPETIDQYTKGEFAEFIQKIIMEIEVTKENGIF